MASRRAASLERSLGGSCAGAIRLVLVSLEEGARTGGKETANRSQREVTAAPGHPVDGTAQYRRLRGPILALLPSRGARRSARVNESRGTLPGGGSTGPSEPERDASGGMSPQDRWTTRS